MTVSFGIDGEKQPAIGSEAEHLCVRQDERVAARTLGGKAIVIVIDRQQLLTLNEVGTRVWELADGRTLGAMAAELSQEFDVDAATALRDAHRLVKELCEIGAVRLHWQEAEGG